MGAFTRYLLAYHATKKGLFLGHFAWSAAETKTALSQLYRVSYLEHCTDWCARWLSFSKVMTKLLKPTKPNWWRNNWIEEAKIGWPMFDLSDDDQRAKELLDKAVWNSEE
eukprot:GHVN01052145.1.p1 GENE.GHVN01052145.1~~GHVN01052145.1.p1  ORF type:complete len:110 (-),score=13.57 GHVN01052145.1:31-360(-)